MATPSSGTPGTPPEPFDWKKWLGRLAIVIVILIFLVFVCPVLFGLGKRVYNWASPPPPVSKADPTATFGESGKPKSAPSTNSSHAVGTRVQPYSLVELNSPTDTGVYELSPGAKFKFVGAPTVRFHITLNPGLYIYSPGAELAAGGHSTNTTVFVENTNTVGKYPVRIIVEPK